MKLQELLREACESHGDVSFRAHYSGRGMFGGTCVGIDGDESQCRAVIAEVIKTLHNDSAHDDDLDFGDQVDMLLGYCTDSMGYGRIFYWPSMHHEESQEESGMENWGDPGQ